LIVFFSLASASTFACKAARKNKLSKFPLSVC
jgi:hypothetical protein